MVLSELSVTSRVPAMGRRDVSKLILRSSRYEPSEVLMPAEAH
jgi:hypothetical protein